MVSPENLREEEEKNSSLLVSGMVGGGGENTRVDGAAFIQMNDSESNSGLETRFLISCYW